MALPALGGYWLDAKLGTGFVFVVIGALLGFALGMVQLLQIAKSTGAPPKEKAARGKNRQGKNRRADGKYRPSE